MFIWTGGYATEHYFVPTKTANIYANEDGSKLTLTEAASSCTIKDSGDKYIYVFKGGFYTRKL